MSDNDWVEFRTSGLVSAAMYDLNESSLSVRFVRGSVLRYLSVPQAFWWGICSAASKDEFFTKHIDGQFVAEECRSSSHVVIPAIGKVGSGCSSLSDMEPFRRWAGPSKVLSDEDFEAYSIRASKGDALAQFAIGMDFVLFRGEPSVASKWLLESAFSDYKPAQKALALMYASGLGVDKDEVDSAAWLFLSTSRSGMEGFRVMYTPADIYGLEEYPFVRTKVADRVFALRGRIREKPQSRGEIAADRFVDDAEAGDPAAQFSLGQAFLSDGKDADAVFWLKRAANQGEMRAQQVLGELFSDGRGVVKSDVESYKWYLLAASQGAGRDKLNVLESGLSASQREEGQRRAELFEVIPEA
jgi:hypothetical protein